MKGPARLAGVIGLVAVAVYLLFSQTKDASSVGAAVKASWTRAAPEWLARLEQDETQRACSQYRNAPPKPVADAILAREQASIAYPADGNVMGDWHKGQVLAQSGYGGRFTDFPPRADNGGNCYACHQLDANELSFGTLGPSLLGYGKNRKFAAAEARAVYQRIYNPQAVMACANMPRLGANRFLKVDQIRDLVAFLMSPESPVNR
jgi:sulfur-oxidizing protein SoxX